MHMSMRSTISFCTCLRLLLRHAFVKIPGLSDVDRNPLSSFLLLGKDNVSSCLSKLRLIRINPVSVLGSGGSDPVNIRFAHDPSLLLQL